MNDELYWLYAAVDPATNRILHSRLFPTYTIPIAQEFIIEVAEKHDVEDTVFLIDTSISDTNVMGIVTASDVSFER